MPIGEKEFRSNFKLFISVVTRDSSFTEPGEYIQLSAFQRLCRKRDISCADAMALIDQATLPRVRKEMVDLDLPLLLDTVEHVRKEKGISKTTIYTGIGMSQSNYNKLYRQGSSINMMAVYLIAGVLGMDASEFLMLCEDRKLNAAVV